MKRASVRLMCGPLVLVLSAQVMAQSPRHMVRGEVFDSVAHTALPGAVVQAVQLDSALQVTARVYWGLSDARGRFTITGVPSGHFAFGFQHEALRALGLESPLRVVELGADADVTVDLAIPPGTVVRARSCDASQGNPNDGMLSGYVIDATSDARLDSATVELRWTEIAQSTGSMSTVPHRVAASSSEDGRFTACGVASDAPINITISRRGFRDLKGEITIPEGGALRRDFRLVGARVQRGTATLAGRVVRADSAPLSAGRLLIPALGVEVPVANGSFTAPGLPAGTWAVEVRAIGYQPQRAMIDLMAQATTSTTIVINDRVQLLAGMRVVGESSLEHRKMVEILARKRVGFGTFFLPGDERLERALFITDVVQLAAGFRINNSGNPEGRVLGGSNGLTRCQPVYFIDGERSPLGMTVQMRDVLAVVAYPSTAGIPVEWRDGRTFCAIAVWTKQ